jgi:hypothetical protein
MRRNTVNFIIDFVSLVVLAALAATGLIIKFVLPPGTGGRGRLLHSGAGREHVKTLLSMSRHQWGDIHFYLSVVFVVLIIVHVVLHWAWIKSQIKSLLHFSPKR